MRIILLLTTIILPFVGISQTSEFIARTQRLVIPAYSSDEKKLFDKGTLNLRAYCADATRTWPVNKPLTQIYFGGATTYLRIKQNGKFTTPSLFEAMKKRVITVISRWGGSVDIVPAKDVQIINFQTNGFGIGEYPEVLSLDSTIVQGLSKDADNFNFYQRIVHRRVHRPEIEIDSLLRIRISEYIDSMKRTSIFKKHGKDWKIEQDGQTIVIHDGNVPPGANKPPIFASFFREFSFSDYDEEEICVEINNDDSTVKKVDSSVKITVTALISGVIPLHIEYIPSFPVIVSIRETGGVNKITGDKEVAILLYHPEKPSQIVYKKEVCKVSTSISLCYPFRISSESEQICGDKYTISYIEINF